jgi:hypothetical protein
MRKKNTPIKWNSMRRFFLRFKLPSLKNKKKLKIYIILCQEAMNRLRNHNVEMKKSFEADLHKTN